MSITSLINPSGDVSVQDSLWHIAYSDNSGQVDFKYVFDIYNGSQQLIRTKVFPEPSNGRGYFDAGNVIRNQIVFDWFVPVNNTDKVFLYKPNASGEVSVTYNIRVGEDYSGVTTLNMASGNVTAYNWRPPLFKRKQNTISVFDNKYLTNRSTSAKLGLTEKLLIGYKGTGTLKFGYLTYDANNTLIASGYSSGTYSSNGFYQLDIGPNAVNGGIGSTFITSSTNYYKIRIENTTNSTVTDWFTIYIDCDSRYTPINLHFMNQYGVFETARFKLVSKLSMDIERKTFEKREYSFGNTSVDYYDANKVYNESKVNYGSKANWTYKLTMDYPSDADFQWLSELITSPIIYAEIGDSYYPVTLKQTNYEYAEHIWAGLRTLEIDIELNQTRYGFRR